MQWLQFGTHVIPDECVGPIDLNFEGGTGQGTFVRVYLRNLGTIYGPNVVSPPTYLDFRGGEAQAVRRWATRTHQTGGAAMIVGAEEETERAGAGKKG